MLRRFNRVFAVGINVCIATGVRTATTRQHHQPTQAILAAVAPAVHSVRVSPNVLFPYRTVCVDDDDCDQDEGEICCPVAKVCDNPADGDAGACGENVKIYSSEY